jgi:hypothetical protein
VDVIEVSRHNLEEGFRKNSNLRVADIYGDLGGSAERGAKCNTPLADVDLDDSRNSGSFWRDLL